jgi:hypothetical protein
MAADHYRSAELLFGWSFYRQSTSGETSSADEFLDCALSWFGDPDPRLGTAWEKGERLAMLVAHSRTLLVLDGLESFQNPPGPQEGRVREPSLQALLRELAAFNTGLCVITTRTSVADIADHEGTSALRRDLEHLSSDAGAKLLRALGVKGQEAELRRASNEFSGHCFALTLLGSYLTDAYNGDIRSRGEVSGHLAHDVRQGVHARRVMESYQTWLGEGPEPSVLRMLGLFDRLNEAEAMAERFEQRVSCAELCRPRGVFLATLGADETQIEASFCAAIRIAREQKSISLEKRAESTYAEYRRQKASAPGGVDSDYLFGNA